jgi:hypothetical protein
MSIRKLHVGRVSVFDAPGSTRRHYDLFDNQNSHVLCPCCGSDRLKMEWVQGCNAGRDPSQDLLHVCISCRCQRCDAVVQIGFNQNLAGGTSIDAGVSGSQG